ncbi:MAG: hypothetical protein K0S24_3459 [Sphingobacterium sp.]|jgi:hypothetical protein|nr:hypothetical protein [Sphingobacterium sp.]
MTKMIVYYPTKNNYAAFPLARVCHHLLFHTPILQLLCLFIQQLADKFYLTCLFFIFYKIDL